MKKLMAMILCLMVAAGTLAGCGTGEEKQDDTLQIVTTIFPEYDWVREILGEMAELADVTMLLDSGVDLHSYQPTADDIIKISDCDLFIYVGGESDEWVEDVLQETENPNRKVINLLEALGDRVKTEEMVEGMQETEHEHEHEEQGEAHEEDHEEESDEHIWLSLKNASVLCRVISNAIQELDPLNQAIYAENTKLYLDKLSNLDESYQALVEEATYDTVLFGDRFPFRYLMDDYGLHYYAAFSGCSAESEASFETILFLANKMDALELPCVLTIDGAKHRIAETIVENTAAKNQKVVTMDSMQSVTSSGVKNGVSYLSIMEKNLAALDEAIG